MYNPQPVCKTPQAPTRVHDAVRPIPLARHTTIGRYVQALEANAEGLKAVHISLARDVQSIRYSYPQACLCLFVVVTRKL